MSDYPDHEPGEIFVEYGEDQDGCSYEVWMDYDELAEKCKAYQRLFTQLHVDLRHMDRMTSYSPTRHTRPRHKPTGLRGLFYDRMLAELMKPLAADHAWMQLKPMDNLSYMPITYRAGEVAVSKQLLNDQ